MKRILATFLTATTLCLSLASNSFAGTFQVSGGIEGARLNYKEYVEGQKVDQDKAGLIGNGIAPNGFEEIRYDNNKFFVREDYDQVRSYTARYSDITGVQTPTKEKITQVEFDMGLHRMLLTIGKQAFGVSPYDGIGYRTWERGIDTDAIYRERQKWGFLAAGVEARTISGRWIWGADAAVLKPFDVTTSTNFEGLTDNVTMKSKPKVGWRVRVPVSYSVWRSEKVDVALAAIPYIEQWRFSRGADTDVTLAGETVGSAFAPTRTSTMIGCKFGVKVTF